MNTQILSQFPIMESNRIIIREMQDHDLNVIYDFNSCIDSLRYIARQPFTDKKAARKKLNFFLKSNKNRTACWWIFTLKETGEDIGYGGLFDICTNSNKAEIGYAIIKKYWNKGYMSEALQEIIHFAMNRAKLHKIYGVILDGNTRSAGLLEKNGFKKEGHLKDHSFARGQYFDECIYGLINDDLE